MAAFWTGLRKLVPRRIRAHAYLKLRIARAALRADRRTALYCRHWVREVLADLTDLLGARRVECPVCGWRGHRFHPYVSGFHITEAANCPSCDSKPRHRVLYLYLSRHLDRLAATATPRRLLDFAPVETFSRALGRLPGVRYMSADLLSTRAMVLTDLRCPGISAETIDVVICYHVLEHIIEDRQAMRELRRILRRDGFGLIQVPIDARLATTEEWGAPNWELHGHVRQYAPDFYDRLREQGFEVAIVNAPDFVAPEDVERHGLILEPFCMVRVGTGDQTT